MIRRVILAVFTFIGLTLLMRATSLHSLALAGQYKGDSNVFNKPNVLYFVAAILLIIPFIRVMRAVERLNNIGS